MYGKHANPYSADYKNRQEHLTFNKEQQTIRSIGFLQISYGFPNDCIGTSDSSSAAGERLLNALFAVGRSGGLDCLRVKTTKGFSNKTVSLIIQK